MHGGEILVSFRESSGRMISDGESKAQVQHIQEENQYDLGKDRLRKRSGMRLSTINEEKDW